uniref:Uncharacterized protein n=1 Tax=Sphaerodactylus townsendi TaxID=933632 RepID=A0ACB8G189_9SAUR
MGNAGSMDSQQTDFRAHNMPLKLPMPEPAELEERFAVVLAIDASLLAACTGESQRRGCFQVAGDSGSG